MAAIPDGLGPVLGLGDDALVAAWPTGVLRPVVEAFLPREGMVIG